MLGGICRCRGPRGEVKFGENVGYVAVDSMLAQDKPCRDLSIAQALRDEPQNFHLPIGQP